MVNRFFKMFTTTVCVIFLIMYTQAGSLVSLKIKTSMSTERSILNIYALGLLAHSVSFCTDFTILNCHLYCTPAKCIFPVTDRNIFELKGVTFVVDCVKCVPIPIEKKKKKPGWPTSMGSWKLDDPPLTKGSKADDLPPLCSSPPPPILFDQSLKRILL